ncbi:pilus assembly protein PilP [Enterobacter hormaechei subsp. steigerwaltii]|uniref:type IV pilus biogenesis protein PilM n=1 Tax=Enterobacter kobei TaxID=208224 RepID=UPI0005EFD819|nr:type IV pilus biogenesis protein PilM [Enterobacter kobei]KJO66653.1 pilus assembly protein PilP [Enterobacter hormaechei subsp. steigerwaltii]KTJ29568.1 pilus assembly protein PilP [Enterobacter hormaechei subsp. xiangfangensis]CZX59758.1 PilM protein [Enterobacter hormaechei]ELK3459405.1 type IV pilus biogenesis protein PilM [Enterobacter kobei]HBM2606544.1 type IV pilus biogenesis protein PilM [Enterobacter hormaechei subsp. xiangfangensis]
MGRVILAISMIFFLIVGDIDSQQNQTSRTAIQTQSGQLYATQILTIANRVNDWRYKTGQTNGTVPVDQLGLPFTPDARIQYRLLQSRLWVWMPEQAGLVDALRAQSRGSALIGTMRSGQLIWLSGLATGLTAPQGVPEGAVVYLN